MCFSRIPVIVIFLTLLDVRTLLADQVQKGDQGTESTRRPAVVEYRKVKNEACLQPYGISANPTDSDLVAAQKRWLAKNYPGYHLVRQQHILTLAPEYRAPGHENDPQSEHDSLEFETADGKPIDVCFGLTVRKVRPKK
jgi:hypothetical protein